jgi:hypothetical protein
MRTLVGLAFGAALVVGVAAFDFSDAKARSCYSIWAEAEESGSYYRHVVYVENDCDHWLECTVWTDVNPQPPKILSVAPDATESAETNSRSEYDDPRAFGTCRSK